MGVLSKNSKNERTRCGQQGNQIDILKSSSTSSFRVENKRLIALILDGKGAVEISIDNGQATIKLFDIEFRYNLREEISFSLNETNLKVGTSFKYCQADSEVDPAQDVIVNCKITRGKMTIYVTENGKILHKQQTEIPDAASDAANNETTTNACIEDASDVAVTFLEVSAPSEELQSGAGDRAVSTSSNSAKSDYKAYADEGDDDDDDDDDEDDDEGEGFVVVSSIEE